VAIEYEKRTLGTDHAREQATDLAERVKAARARLHQIKRSNEPLRRCMFSCRTILIVFQTPQSEPNRSRSSQAYRVVPAPREPSPLATRFTCVIAVGLKCASVGSLRAVAHGAALVLQASPRALRSN
jgi:hypothetical protein